MERQQHLDVQRLRLLQHRLHLGAVLAHNVGVVAPRLVQIVAVKVHLIGEQRAVQGAEAAEGVRRQQQLVRGIVGQHHLRPVDHGRRHKVQGVPSGGQRLPLLDNGDAPRQLRPEELADHGLGHGAAQHLRLGIVPQQVSQLRCVVRLHVVHHHVVQLPSRQGVGQVLPKRMAHRAVHRVEQHGLFVCQQIAVEADALRHIVHALKHRQTPAVGAHPCIIVVDLSRAVHRIILSAACAGMISNFGAPYRRAHFSGNIIAELSAVFHCFLPVRAKKHSAP